MNKMLDLQLVQADKCMDIQTSIPAIYGLRGFGDDRVRLHEMATQLAVRYSKQGRSLKSIRLMLETIRLP